MLVVNHRFPIMIAASLIVFYGVIRLVLRRRGGDFPLKAVLVLGVVVVVGGMLYGYHAARAGWPGWRSTAAMLLTVFPRRRSC